jgi:EAL domain-containing protein (putative c-di-GMP-specific phosphodiesterase class I)
MSVAINLSARNLHEQDLAAYVGRLMHDVGVEPSLVTLEITESAVMGTDPQVGGVIDALAGLGVDLAVDDFGTGYSSLSYLRRLPASEIKIDQSFVRHLILDEQDASIVKWTIALCRTLGRRTVAEGVEDGRTLQRLRQMGCERAQGYHIARPMPIGELLDFLRANPPAEPHVARTRTKPPTHSRRASRRPSMVSGPTIAA